MNCETFRRRLLEEPGSKDPGFLAHAQSCPRCREEWQAALEFEARLQRALQMPPPLSHPPPYPEPPVQSRFRYLALAGALLGLALVVLTVTGVFRPWQEAAGVPGLVARHIRSEPGLLTRQQPLDPVQVSRVMAPRHYRMRRLSLAVVAAAPCWIRSGRGVHLVMQGNEGPVTVLIMPAERVATARKVQEAGMRGLVMPAVQGSVAVVALSPTDLEAGIGYLQQNLLWRGRPAIISF